MGTETEQKIRRNTEKFQCGECGYTKALWLITEEIYYCWACGHKQTEKISQIDHHDRILYEEVNQQLWENMSAGDEIVGYRESCYNTAFPYNVTGAIQLFVKSPSLKERGYVIIILSTAVIFKEVQDFVLDNEIPLLSDKKCFKLNYSVIMPDKS